MEGGGYQFIIIFRFITHSTGNKQYIKTQTLIFSITSDTLVSMVMLLKSSREKGVTLRTLPTNISENEVLGGGGHILLEHNTFRRKIK